jgi:hypothetical protein
MGAIAARSSTWPNVIGTLICVFAGIGILQRVFGTIVVAFMPAFPLPQNAQLPHGLWVFTLALSVVSLPISFVHLAAGVQTLRRKASARRWVVILFVYVVVMLPPAIALQYWSMQHQMSVASQQGGAPPGFAAWGTGFAVGAAIAGALFTLVWPTFLLVWYSRSSIREELADWAAAKGGR